MTEHIKNHGLNLLIKILVTLGAVGFIYFTLTSFLFKQSTNLDKTEPVYKAEQNENFTTDYAKVEDATSTPISREQLAAGLIAMHNTTISIPESLTSAQYENLIASSTLSKEQVARHLGQDTADIFPAGPGFLTRGGQGGLQIYLPSIQNALDDELVRQGQTLVRVYIDSILDKNGKNVLDTESPFEQKSFFNKLKFEKIITSDADKYYKTERTLYLKGDQLSILDEKKKINGSVVVNLPVSVNKYTLSFDQIVTKSKIKVGNAQISVAEVKEGAIYLNIKSANKTVLYIKCFNQNGELISTSMVTAIDPEEFTSNGFDKQSILSFNLGEQVDHLEVYAPSEILVKKYRFAI